MAVTKPHKTSQPAAYKPLTPAQENAIDLLMLGKPDREVAEAAGVTRETVWHWRHEHPVFLAELNRRRQALWADAHDRLRALVAKAIQRLEEAIEREVLSPAALLKVVGLCVFVGAPAGDTDPEKIIHQQAEAQVDREGVARNSLTAMLENLDNAAWRRRLGEVEAEIRQRYAVVTVSPVAVAGHHASPDADRTHSTANGPDRPRRPCHGQPVPASGR